MSCNSCNPIPNGFRPTGAPPRPYNAGNLARRNAPPRWRVFSTRLDRISALAQNPARITLRELVLFVFTLYALYAASSAAGRIYDLLARRDVGLVCRGATAMACLRFHILLCIGVVFDWAGIMLPWALFGAVVVFGGEEVWRAWRR